MPNLFPVTRFGKLVAACLAGWLVCMSAAALWRAAAKDGQAGLAATFATLDAARETLGKIRAEAGRYPSTDGRWLAVSPGDLAATLGGGGSPDAFSRCLKPWTGGPGQTVIYRSDGREYKLIWHKSGDCTAARASRPDLIDPVRTAYSRVMIPGGWEASSANEAVVAFTREPAVKPDPAVANPLFGECWAYGVWTKGALFW